MPTATLDPKPNRSFLREPSFLAGKRVVICEDEGTTLLLLQRIVRMAEMQLVGAAIDGKTIVDLVAEAKPDIVLMDINLPGMDGLEATQRIMETSPTCVVMLTAYSTDDHADSAYALGVSGYVTKPVSPDWLIREMEEAYLRFNAAPSD